MTALRPQVAPLLLFLATYLPFTYASSVTPFLEQSFFFDYNDPSQPLPVPVTQQCETINIKWGRSTATGPNPVSPYYLKVFSSSFNVPFIIPAGEGLSFDWQVPFAPGSLYQICMFDKNGNTGGCQATYSMIPADSTPNCPNITFHPILDVDAEVNNGPMSQFGWIDQCTDISLTPKNGTPPYTMTVAPALHPPYNITLNDMKAVNWTVTLSWGYPFFVSLADSVGNVWSNGLLHSGAGESSTCLSAVNETQQAQPEENTIKPAVAIGSGIGGLVAGLLLGALSTVLLLKCQRRRRGDVLLDTPPGSPQGVSYGHPISMTSASDYRAVPSTGIMDSSMGTSGMSSNSIQNRTNYTVEPFLLPGEHGQLPPAPTSPQGGSTHNLSANSSQPRQGAVYVMHHDSGRAPVSVYHEDGTQVVELPPQYLEGASDLPSTSPSDAQSRVGSDARSETGRTDPSETPSFLNQPRRPAAARKPGSREGRYANNTST